MQSILIYLSIFSYDYQVRVISIQYSSLFNHVLMFHLSFYLFALMDHEVYNNRSFSFFELNNKNWIYFQIQRQKLKFSFFFISYLHTGLPSVPHLGVQYPIRTVCTSKKFVPLGYKNCTPFGLFPLCIRLKQYFSRINKIIDFSWHLRLYCRETKSRLHWLINEQWTGSLFLVFVVPSLVHF